MVKPVVPWRKSDPDVFIPPSSNFAGAQFAGDARRSGAKLEQFLVQSRSVQWGTIQPSAGSESERNSGAKHAGKCAVERRAAVVCRDRGPDQRAGAHSPATRAAASHGDP